MYDEICRTYERKIDNDSGLAYGLIPWFSLYRRKSNKYEFPNMAENIESFVNRTKGNVFSHLNRMYVHKYVFSVITKRFY